MCNLMRYCLCNTVIKIFCEDIGVVTNLPRTTLHPIHASSTSSEIEAHGDYTERPLEDLLCLQHTGVRGTDNHTTLGLGEWLNNTG